MLGLRVEKRVLGQGPGSSFCKDVNEVWVSMKCGEFID
jgi:hypothetical protein